MAKRNAKKNIQTLQKRLKRIRQQMIEVEKEFYVKFAKAVESEISKESCTVDSIKLIYENLKQEYGL